MITFILNGKEVFSENWILSYDDIVELAGYKKGTILTITVKQRDKSAFLYPSMMVYLSNGAVVNAYLTGDA